MVPAGVGSELSQHLAIVPLTCQLQDQHMHWAAQAGERRFWQGLYRSVSQVWQTRSAVSFCAIEWQSNCIMHLQQSHDGCFEGAPDRCGQAVNLRLCYDRAACILFLLIYCWCCTIVVLGCSVHCVGCSCFIAHAHSADQLSAAAYRM